MEIPFFRSVARINRISLHVFQPNICVLPGRINIPVPESGVLTASTL